MPITHHTQAFVVFSARGLETKLGFSGLADTQTCKVAKVKESLSWDAVLPRIVRARDGRALAVVCMFRRTGCLVMTPLIYIHDRSLVVTWVLMRTLWSLRRGSDLAGFCSTYLCAGYSDPGWVWGARHQLQNWAVSSLKTGVPSSITRLEGLGSRPVLSQCTGISHFSFLKLHSSSAINPIHSSRG